MVNKILIIAGEASGDLHASALMQEYLNLDSTARFYGIGGDNMIKAGLMHSYHINDMAFLGFVEIIKHLPFIRKVRKLLIELVKKEGIKNVILVDYPGFNLNFAKAVKKLDVNIIYYISPQIWAWGGKRIEKIKSLVNLMLVLFPFEEDFYLRNNVNAVFIGHPLLDRINNYNFIDKETFYKNFNLDINKNILLVLPGSRHQEIEKILPETLKAAKLICKKHNMQTVVACSSNINENVFSDFNLEDAKLIKGFTYELFKYSSFGIIKSGTSTLEAALFELPFIVVYKTNIITYYLGKALIKIDSIALANIVAGKKIVKELIQNDVNVNNLTEAVSKYLDDIKLQEEIKKELKVLRNKLGSTGASKKAAQLIFNTINGN
ncbi:MAG TPA: lipid-A-disaccharide synthase [Melioribacteraceae bacterium]|nr:lipid-A-disaccharide synthase [Melioribacteraceae bacterium]